MAASNEIVTVQDLLDMVANGFSYSDAGLALNECPTKQQIENYGNGNYSIVGSYQDNELVQYSDISIVSKLLQRYIYIYQRTNLYGIAVGDGIIQIRITQIDGTINTYKFTSIQKVIQDEISSRNEGQLGQIMIKYYENSNADTANLQLIIPSGSNFSSVTFSSSYGGDNGFNFDNQELEDGQSSIFEVGDINLREMFLDLHIDVTNYTWTFKVNGSFSGNTELDNVHILLTIGNDIVRVPFEITYEDSGHLSTQNVNVPVPIKQANEVITNIEAYFQMVIPNYITFDYRINVTNVKFNSAICQNLPITEYFELESEPGNKYISTSMNLFFVGDINNIVGKNNQIEMTFDIDRL